MIEHASTAPAQAIGVPASYRRNTLLAMPFILAVPLAFAIGFQLWGMPLNGPAVGIGALGWVAALLLRNPIAMIALHLLKARERAQPWIVAASGPCEESMRLVALLLLGRSFPLALSIGLGWAAIEVVFTCVNTLAIRSLLSRTDDKARQALEMLKSQGMESTLSGSAPFLGVIERLSASGIHIGFTLLLAWQPLLVLGTIPTHSVINFLALRLTRRSAVLAEVALLLIGAALLLAGFVAFGRL